MSLLDAFQELMDDVEVYSIEASTSTWGTSEPTYSSIPAVVSGFVQPVSGSVSLVNQARNIETTHRLYCYASETILDTDRIVANGETYYVTENQPAGIGGISDHLEVGLKRGQ
jgi:hypothetical protein